MQNRAFGAKRGSDAGNRIGAAGSGRRHHAAELSGLTCVTISRVCGGLFVAYVDNFYTFIETAIVDIDNMPAAEGKNGINTFGF